MQSACTLGTPFAGQHSAQAQPEVLSTMGHQQMLIHLLQCIGQQVRGGLKLHPLQLPAVSEHFTTMHTVVFFVFPCTTCT